MSERHGLRQQLGRIREFIGFVYPQARRKTQVALAVLLLAGLTEGLSILLLVPLLAQVAPGATDLTISLPSSIATLAGNEQLTISLAAILIGMVGLIAAQAMLMRLSSLIVVDAVLTMTDRLRVALFGSIALARWRHLVRSRHADLYHAITTDVERVQAVTNGLFLLVQGLFMLGVYSLASLLISPTMTAIALGLGLVFLTLLHPIRRYASQYGERVTEQRQTQYRTIGEFLGGLKLVKSLNAEPRYLRAFSSNVDSISSEIRRFFRISAVPGLLFQIMSAAAAAVFVYVAIRFLALPLERIAVLLFVFMRIAPRFSAIQTNVQQILLNIGGYGSVRSLIVAFGAEREALAPAAGGLRLERSLVFEHVGFSYEATAAGATLIDVDFTLPAGLITAVIGPSGGGKSTLADLMLGLLEPSSGIIRVDGAPLDDQSRRRWRNAVSYVPQEVFLAHDTIAGNLRLASPHADEAALWRALRQAQADGFVEALPQGLHTVVGERGARLSGGERQRIALARALLTKPQLLILDEATSALDWENQSLIARAIEQLRGEITIVTIAHRPSMIAFADQVVAVENGRIVETGAFAEVLGRADSRLARLMAGEQRAEG